MCNPTGKADGWRGWDWLQERNNLYTKVSHSFSRQTTLNNTEQVIFSGRGPNRTQALIMKRSILIEVYRSAHQVIENNFYLSHRTIRHSSPKMRRTIAKLQSYIEDPTRSPHIFTPGRTVAHQIPDCVSDGFALLTQSTDIGTADDVDSDKAAAVTGEDLGVS